MMDLTQAKQLAAELKVYMHDQINPGFLLYGDDKVGLYFTEGVSHSYHLFVSKELHQNPYFFIQLPWHHDRALLARCVEFYRAVTGGHLGVERLILLANSQIELDAALAEGLKYSQLINHNAWLDFDLFRPNLQQEKHYDLVLNTRPETWKRPELAAKVENLAIIKGANHRPSAFTDLSLLNPKYMNEERLTLEQVVQILDRCRCGGIFSAIEGACYSSSEYLLMGLPVVSTPSLGGRDYWFTKENSVICEPTADSVAQSVALCLRNLADGTFSPHRIREEHVRKSIALRKAFIDLMGQILSENQVSADPGNIFHSNYRGGKMVRYTKV